MVFFFIIIIYSLQARNVFEEGIANVQTVRDFTQIFDAYAKFEEDLINSKMVSSISRLLFPSINNDNNNHHKLNLYAHPTRPPWK